MQAWALSRLRLALPVALPIALPLIAVSSAARRAPWPTPRRLMRQAYVGCPPLPVRCCPMQVRPCRGWRRALSLVAAVPVALRW